MGRGNRGPARRRPAPRLLRALGAPRVRRVSAGSRASRHPRADLRARRRGRGAALPPDATPARGRRRRDARRRRVRHAPGDLLRPVTAATTRSVRPRGSRARGSPREARAGAAPDTSAVCSARLRTRRPFSWGSWSQRWPRGEASPNGIVRCSCAQCRSCWASRRPPWRSGSTGSSSPRTTSSWIIQHLFARFAGHSAAPHPQLVYPSGWSCGSSSRHFDRGRRSRRSSRGDRAGGNGRRRRESPARRLGGSGGDSLHAHGLAADEALGAARARRRC